MTHFKSQLTGQTDHVIPITMWDFSWLERRWPGAGYEDWGQALDELKERGYEAVRIDAFPHLVHHGPEKTWTLLPVWDQHDWGATVKIDVQVMPALLEFMQACKDREISVGLSSWFREDLTNVRLNIASAKAHAEIWITTLQRIEEAGLLDAVLYVDACNEWPMPVWAPFYHRYWGESGSSKADWSTPSSVQWMKDWTALMRQAYPDLAYTFSFTGKIHHEIDLSFFDLLEPHVWMSGYHFYKHIDYKYENFDAIGYEKVARYADPLYRSDEAFWKGHTRHVIEEAIEFSVANQLPLMTTECWAITNFKDYPGMPWDWVLELNEYAVQYALKSRKWTSMATSNFCAPQFVGMWREVEWHQRLTELMKNTKPDF